MAEERKRQGDDSAAAAKKQRSEDDGGKAAVTGDEILTLLVDYDEESMREVMDYLLLPSPPAAGAVCFTDDPYTALPPQSPSSSYVTINTGNEESCGSSYSEAASFMASLAPDGAPVGPIAGGGAQSSPDGGISMFEALADDPDGGDFLTDFLGEAEGEQGGKKSSTD